MSDAHGGVVIRLGRAAWDHIVVLLEHELDVIDDHHHHGQRHTTTIDPRLRQRRLDIIDILDIIDEARRRTA